MDLVTFAAQRDAQLTSLADEYRPAVESALQEPVQEDRTAEFVAALTVLFLLTYGDEGGNDSTAQDAADWFVGTMRAALDLTEPDDTEAQVDRISTWLATATLGAATLKASESNAQPGDELVKTWITMLDDKVRDTHQPLHGESQPMDGFFTVKTEPPADMQFPGQPTGPPEAWINCRCVLLVSAADAMPGSLSASFARPTPALPGGSDDLPIVMPVLASAGSRGNGRRRVALPDVGEMIRVPEVFGVDAKRVAAQVIHHGGPVAVVHDVGEAVRRDLLAQVADPERSVLCSTSCCGTHLAAGPVPAALGLSNLRPEPFVLAECPSCHTPNLPFAVMTAAGSKGGFSGVVIVALPEGDNMITYNDGDTTEMHQTIVYLGSTDQLQPAEKDEVLAVGQELAASMAPFTARVAGIATLGEDQDAVAITEAEELQRLHETARGNETVEAMYRERNGHPTWISHITARDLAPGDEVTFDRIGVWFGGDDHRTFEMGAPVSDTMIDDVDVEETVVDDGEPDDLPPIPDEPIAAEDANMLVHGVLAPEGVDSGDGRSFAPGTTVWRDLPIPLKWQRADTEEHNGSVIVGKVTMIERRGNLLHWAGEILDVPESEEVIYLIAEQALRGVSVDMDNAEITQVTEPESEFAQPSVEYAGRISALTIVSIAAFPETFIALGPEPGIEATDDEPLAAAAYREYDAEQRRKMAENGTAMEDGSFPIADVEDLRNAIQAIGRAKDPEAAKAHIRKRARALDAEGLIPDTWSALTADASDATDRIAAFKRGSGWITNPEDTARLHRYWTKGKGAAKIRWGTSGDFTRCTRQLRKYIDPLYLNRTCAQWHHDALGYWPGECGRPGNPPCGAKRGNLSSEGLDMETVTAAAPNHSHSVSHDHSMHMINLVAAAPPVTVPAEWFSDPGLDGPTPLTVTPEGRVFGHIAKWGTCHIGIDRTCVTPPKSRQDYAFFHLGTIDTDGGELAVGSLTLGTGHADLKLSSTDTARHYDHTGTAVAKVRAGEDEHGIWVAGTICEGVSDDQVRTLRSAGGISGDWRSIGGSLELVAALAVNVPGFPVPRPALAASGGRQTALVAAGVVETVGDNDPHIEAIAAAVVAKLDANKRRSQKLAALDATKAEVRARRLAALSSTE